MQQARTKTTPIMIGPTCMACDEKMLLARVLPHDNEQELHIFECARCRQSKSEVVKF